MGERDKRIGRAAAKVVIKAREIAARRADDLITEWEAAHRGQMIFGSEWRRKLRAAIEDLPCVPGE